MLHSVDSPYSISPDHASLKYLAQDSIGGKSHTAIIVCCSPSSDDSVETLAALRFATRAAGVVNTSQVRVQNPKANRWG